MHELLVVLALILQLVFPDDKVRVYDGQNKGVTFGVCGIELVGVPGFYCNAED